MDDDAAARHTPKTFRRTDRTDAPHYLARYSERRATTVTRGSGTPPPPGADDANTPLYLRRFRDRQDSAPTPTRSVPLEFEGERFSPEYAAVTRSHEIIPEERRDADTYVTEIRIIRHGITQGYSTDAGLTPMGGWQAHQRGQALARTLREWPNMRIVCADTNRARQTAEQIHRGLLDGLDQYGRDSHISPPEAIDELKNFQVWTPDGIRDITASFRKYQAEMEKLERMAAGDRPRWLVEIDRFYRTQLGGADPIQQWLTIPLMYFESPQSCVRRFWKGFLRLVEESPGAADHRRYPLRPDPRVRHLGARLRPGRAGQHRGGRRAHQEGRSDGDRQLPQPRHRGERAARRRDPGLERMNAPNGKALAAIVGPGNIGTDLLAKLRRSEHIEVGYMVGVDPSPTAWPARASSGIEASAEGSTGCCARTALPQIVFEATSAKAHAANAPRYAEAGIAAIDLTPAAVGPLVCPPVNLHEHLDAPNINMITCGGQATIPIVHAVVRGRPGAVRRDRRVGRVAVGRPGHPGEHRRVHRRPPRGPSRASAAPTRGKAIIMLNPVEPPMIMRDTVFCAHPGRRRPRRDHRVGRTRWSPRCRSTCPATRCAPTRSSTHRASPGTATAGSTVFLEVRGRRRLPARRTPATSTS